jgi:hypothetical protein
MSRCRVNFFYEIYRAKFTLLKKVKATWKE